MLGGLILTALIAFELFNFTTTEYSLRDLLGDLTFLSIRWSTILSIAFCGIDFAGLARMFTPEPNNEEPAEVWYLFGAWLLAATMNAMLTWWGVSVAILNHPPSANAMVNPGLIIKVVPIFVAVMVWLIRVLIIGAFSIAGDKIFQQPGSGSHPGASRFQSSPPRTYSESNPAPAMSRGQTSGRPVVQSTFRPPPRQPSPYNEQRSEPTYRPISMDAAGHEPDDFPMR
jgi:hypothetical protein